MVVVVGLTETAVPLVMVMEEAPPVRRPVPPENSPVIIEFKPAVMVAGTATRLVIAGGAAFTVTVTVEVTAVPLGLVTVSV